MRKCRCPKMQLYMRNIFVLFDHGLKKPEFGERLLKRQNPRFMLDNPALECRTSAGRVHHKECQCSNCMKLAAFLTTCWAAFAALPGVHMLHACGAVCYEQRRLQQLLHECDALCVCGCHHVPVDPNSSNNICASHVLREKTPTLRHWCIYTNAHIWSIRPNFLRIYIRTF